MKWKVISAIAILFIGIYLVVASPFHQQKPLTQGKTAEEILQLAKSEGQRLASYKYRASLSAGDLVSMDLTGKVQVKSGEQLIDFSWNGPQGYGESSVYTKGAQTFIYHPLKNTWYTPKEQPALGKLVTVFKGQLGLINPYVSLDKMDLAKINAANTGAEQVGGQETTVIEVSKGAPEQTWLKEVLPPQLIGAKVTDLKQVYWIGTKDLKIYKYLVTAKIKVFAIAAAELNIRTTVEEFNNTTVKRPDTLQKKMQ